MATPNTPTNTMLSKFFGQEPPGVAPLSNADVLKDANNISRLVKSFSAHQEQKEQAAAIPPTLKTGPVR